MLEIPDDILGPRATVSQINGISWSKELSPNRLIFWLFEIVSDGISDHEKIEFMLGEFRYLFFVALLKSTLGNRYGGRIGLKCRRHYDKPDRGKHVT